MEGVTPDALLQNLERYAAPGNARRRLATALASIGFVFVVDHEYQHLANQHAYLSSQSQPQQASPDYYLAMQALEMDADTYSINRWADMLLGDDRFLEGVGFTDVLDILQAQDRAAAYALFVYAMFCAFRGLGQKDWHGGFTFESRHPPAPFRFKIALVVLWDRLQKPASSHERKTYERLLPVVWPLMEFLYTHGSGNSPSMRSVDEVASPEATRHFEALYKRWHDLVSSGAVTGWHGIPPLE